MTTIDVVRRQVRQFRSAVDELLVGGTGKQPVRDPLPKALQHLADLHRETALPARSDDEAAHLACISNMQAHCLAAAGYLNFYRDIIPRDIIPPAVPNLEGETDPSPAAERSRAVVAALMAGYGKTPTKPRRY
jgi:hypothetical protein